MIFVTLGTQKFQFDRLLKYIDEKIESKEINEEVFAQIGNSTYTPVNYQFKKFLDKTEFEESINKANLVITHSGVGTIISSITKRKPVIVVPRLARFGEHVDDHQLQISESFSNKNLVISNGEEISDLINNIDKARVFKFDNYISSNEKIQNEIFNYIENMEERMQSKKVNVLMLGSDLSVKGGIVSVIRNYLEYKDWNNVKIKFIPTHKEGSKLYKMFYFFISLIKIDMSLLLKKYDIAHIHVSERGSIFRKCMVINHIKFLSKKTKIVLHHHGAEIDMFYDSLNNKKKEKVNNMLKKADVNIVLSNRLIDTIKSKQPEARVEVLYNAVNTYDKNMYNNDGNIILFLGRLGQRKGTYDVLDVLKEIKNELAEKQIKVYLCGDGDVDIVKEKVKEYNLQEIIGHVGWINKEEKKEIFENTIINLLPSYNEGLPMTILETMAYGIPNLSTNIASIPEVIKNGETGYMVTPGDKKDLKEKLILLVNDKSKRKELSNNSYNLICNNFSLNNNINQIISIYKK